LCWYWLHWPVIFYFLLKMVRHFKN
jgi:hypothetical protein